MSKFCGNCGAQMDDNAVVCGYCGARMDGKAAETPVFKLEDPEKKKKTKKIVSMVLGGVALIVVLAISINVILSFVGYKGFLRKVMKEYKSNDAYALTEMAPDFLDDYIEDDYYDIDDILKSKIEDPVDAQHRKFEDEVGHNCKISYDVVEYYTIEGKRLEEKFAGLSSYSDDFEKGDVPSEVDKVVAAVVEVKAKKGKKTEEIEITVVMCKADGKWSLLGISEE